MGSKFTPKNKLTVFDRKDQFKNEGLKTKKCLRRVEQIIMDRSNEIENASKKETALKIEETVNKKI